LPDPARAQAARFPDRPVRVIVPWSAGSSSDVQIRSLADVAPRWLGQPVVVENKPGASGTLHISPLIRETRADGYTLGQMHLSVIRRPFLTRSAQWDLAADFTYVIGLVGWVIGVAVRADAPWRSFPEFVESAKREPGRRTYSTSGIATTPHLIMEDIGARAGAEFTHVPFRGSSEGLTAVLGGQVDAIADASVWAPHVMEGRMRALCLFTPERYPRFPGVPTLRELGIDLVATSAYGLVGPAGIDPGVVRVLHDAFKAALQDPAVDRVRAQFDMPVVYLDSAAYRDTTLRQAEYERALVQRLGLRLD
ncbi:MAG: tripartite tricarboxylate transporter substrate binding protein, partial [Acetobacteraceae bacterium]|nr:tripartite tricarboxylate transporter substrate binding protein [Acetobacteraceae bacterium]